MLSDVVDLLLGCSGGRQVNERDDRGRHRERAPNLRTRKAHSQEVEAAWGFP